MRVLRVSAVAVAGALLMGAEAAAEAPPPWASPFGYRAPVTPSYDNSFLDQAWRQSQTEIAQVRATRPEWIRARRAAALVNANRCADAYALARMEQDERLASGVKKVCTTPLS